MEAFLDILEVIGCVAFVVFFLGFCVFIHELGHFLTAKMCGLHVNAFSIGFKKAWGKKINGVDYRIGWLPFGGYVDIPQIDSTEIPHTAEGKELPPAKPIHRLLSAFAGPFFNILFGFALGVVVWIIGVPQDSPKMREIEIQSIDKAGPEYIAGLRKGDKILKINGDKFFDTWRKLVFKIILDGGKVTLDVKRDGKVLKISYVPKLNPKAPDNIKFEEMPWPYFQPKIPITMFPRKGMPAAKAGMQNHDIIVSVNGRRIENINEFVFLINYSKGKELNITVDRKGEIIKLAPIKPILHEQIMKRLKGLYLIGADFDGKSIEPRIAFIQKGSPASKAGLKVGDIVKKINRKEVASIKDFYGELRILKNTPFDIQVKRGEKLLDFRITAIQQKIYMIGVNLIILDYPTPWRQFVDVINMSIKSLKGLGIFFANKIGITKEKSSIKPKNLSGPLNLAVTLYSSVETGSIRFGLYFVVLVSFALAIFNLLPLPVLDGGHMTLALVEIIIRKPVHEGTVKVLTFIFIFLLITLMIYVTFYDVQRLHNKLQRRFGSSTKIEEKVKETVVEKKDVKKTPVKTDKSR